MKNRLSIVLILLLGLIVRWQFLDVPVIGDEFTVIIPATFTSEGRLPMYPVIPGTNLVNLGHPPFALLIYGGFIKLFDGLHLSPRVLLIAFSLGKIFLVYLIARTCGFSKRTAILSSGLYAVAFDGAVADMETNFGAVGYFFILGFVYLFFKYISTPKFRLLMAASAFLGFALFSYIVPSVLSWGALALSSIMVNEHRKNVRPLIVMLALGVLFYLLLWSIYLVVFGGGPELFFRPLAYLFVTKFAIAETVGLGAAIKNVFTMFMRPAGLLPILIAALIGLRRLNEPMQRMLVASSAIFVALMVGTISTVYFSRYFANTYPFIAIVLAAGMQSIRWSKGEIHRNAFAVLAFLGLLLVKYYDELGTYFWISTKTSSFLSLWYLPVAVAVLSVLLQVVGKVDFEKAGGVCLSVFLAYTVAHYAAFQAGLPVASFGAEYYSTKQGILEAGNFIKQNINPDESIMAPPDLAYDANMSFRNLDIYSMLIFNDASQTGIREAYGSDIPKYSPGLFCKYNVKFVIIPKDALDDVPPDRMRDVDAGYERIKDIGRYGIFGRRPGWNFNRCT